MEKKSENSEEILLEILKQQKFNFTSHELDSILDYDLQEKLFGRICLISEEIESCEKVKIRTLSL